MKKPLTEFCYHVINVCIDRYNRIIANSSNHKQVVFYIVYLFKIAFFAVNQ
jgi:hypothetical protein